MTDIQRGDYVRYRHKIYEVYGVHPDNGVRIGMDYVSAHLLERVTPAEARKARVIIGCGCYGVPVNNDQRFFHCPLHGSAPKLLEACQEALGWIYEQDLDIRPYGVIDALESAIKQALRQA